MSSEVITHYFFTNPYNKELFDEINRYFITDSFSTVFYPYMDTILIDVPSLNENTLRFLEPQLLQRLKLVINKIILSNLFHYVKENNAYIVTELLANSKLQYYIETPPYYIIELREIFDNYLENEEEFEALYYALERMVSDILESLFTSYGAILYPIIVNLFNYMLESLSNVKPSWYIVDIFTPTRPFLIFSEERIEHV